MKSCEFPLKFTGWPAAFLSLLCTGNNKRCLVIWCWQGFVETTVRTSDFQVYTVSSNWNPQLQIEIIFENSTGENLISKHLIIAECTLSLFPWFFFPPSKNWIDSFCFFFFHHLLLILMLVFWRHFQKCSICYESCLFHSSLL